MSESIPARVAEHLAALVRSTHGRPVGSAANHDAEAYIAGVLRDGGYEVEQQAFDCVDWQPDGAELWLGDGPLPVTVNPFSPACDVTAPLVFAGSLLELEAADITGKIVVLRDQLTAKPLFPKNYPFFTVDEHKHIIDLLETGRPRAVIAISPTHGDPAPIIEDGDFGLPSVTVAADVGSVLADADGPITLHVRSTTRPGHGANVIGLRAHPARDKIILCAHFDTKPGTPGALDNAAGVASVLTLAERLAAGNLGTNLEIVAFNGEDHYAAPGEVAYINRCASEFGRIALLINIDGVGLRDHSATVAFFNCADEWMAKVRAAMAGWPRIEETEPWPESDHSIFAMQGVPCLALTSGGIHDLVDGVIHTPNDTLALVEPEQIGLVVEFLEAVIQQTGPPRKAFATS